MGSKHNSGKKYTYSFMALMIVLLDHDSNLKQEEIRSCCYKA